MLTQLKIENIAVTEKISLDISEGFSVLTGETGAGKSVIVGALGLILGDTFSASLVRAGADKASVSAVFEIDNLEKLKNKLEQFSLLPEDNVLIIKREVTAEGKGRTLVNGERVSVTQLKVIGQYLVDIHGQHQHQSLLSVSKQLEMLDSFVGNDDELKEFAANFSDLKKIVKERDALLGEGNEKDKLVDFYRFNLNELNSLDYHKGELETLESDFRKMASAEEIIATGSRSVNVLAEGENSISEKIGSVIRDLESIDADDKCIEELVEQLENANIQINDAAESLSDFISDIDTDPENIRYAEERIERINEIKRKYHLASADDILVEIETLEDKLNHLLSMDKELKSLDDRINKLLKVLNKSCKSISDKRKKAAKDLSKTIDAELHKLGMKSAVFKVDFSEQKMNASGADKVEFMFSANKGVLPSELKKCASGGELSRLMLALKAVCASKDSIPVLVFDEIDSNIGGRLGDVIGEKMLKLSTMHQVLCITHLPQIAGFGHNHFYVAKDETKSSVRVSVVELNADEREKEIARMLGGSNYSDAALLHAKEIIVSASGK